MITQLIIFPKPDPIAEAYSKLISGDPDMPVEKYAQLVADSIRQNIIKIEALKTKIAQNNKALEGRWIGTA